MFSASAVLPTLGRAASTIDFAAAEAAGELVEALEARAHADDLARLHALDVLERRLHLVLDRGEAGLRAVLGDRQHLALGVLDQLETFSSPS